MSKTVYIKLTLDDDFDHWLEHDRENTLAQVMNGSHDGVEFEEVKSLFKENVLICPFCESDNTTVIEAVSDCACDDCGKDFKC